MSRKFKQGDVLEPIIQGTGFEQATVVGTFTETKGIHKGKEMYLLRIHCGTATVPVSVESNYQIAKKIKSYY